MMPTVKLLKLTISILLVTLFMVVTIPHSTYAQDPANFPNCRLGVGGAFGPNVTGYNMGQLNIGTYMDWLTRSNPAAEIGLPTNIEYIQTVRVHQDKVGGWDSAYVVPPTYSVSPTLATLASRAASRPGSLWLIGNEIDRRDWSTGLQDEITPELYATAFHEIRAVIKAADPTARIGIGGMVQATPLRLKYLDRVWDSYYNQYGYRMGDDIDVWNLHGFLLREVRGEWGADIPAGLETPRDYLPQEGFLYGVDDATAIEAADDMVYYRQFIEDFRTWMAEHGERNKPLLNTEYGILNDIGGDTKVIQFLTNTFNYMFTKTDADIGYPADENRLVQGWIWYSLNDNTSYFQYGTLFDSSQQLTPVGTGWKNYVTSSSNPLASQSRRNLLVVNLGADPAMVLPGQTTSVTLRANIANSGNIATSTGNSILVNFWDNVPNQPGSNLIASRTLPDIPGCGGYVTVEVEWPNRPAGNFTWYVQAVPITGEPNTVDNIASSSVVVTEGVPVADLAVAKASSSLQPHTGDVISYIIIVTNNGPDPVTGVKVNDILPAGVTFKSYTASQGSYYTSGVWEVGQLANAAEATLVINVQVNLGQGGQTIINTAQAISAARADVVPANDSDNATITPTETWGLHLPLIKKS